MKVRKRNRLEGYDYSNTGWYYITACTKNRINWLGNILNGKMLLSSYGVIVQERWLWLKNQYPYIELDEFVIMPNHIHGIIILQNESVTKSEVVKAREVLTGRDLSLQRIKPLSGIIGAFKTTSSKLIHLSGLKEFEWRRSFL